MSLQDEFGVAWWECCTDDMDAHCRDRGDLSRDRTVWWPNWDEALPDEVNRGKEALRPVVIIEQDEVIYKSNDDQRRAWRLPGVSLLKSKTDGAG